MITEEKHDSIMQELQTLANKAVADKDRDGFKDFLTTFYPTSSADDLLERPHDELIAIAKYFWKAAAKRGKGKSQVSIFNAKQKDGMQSDHTIITIINDDMPFLVDSISGGLTGQIRTRLHMMHHPITEITRSDKGIRKEIIGMPIIGEKPAPGVT